MKVNIDHDFHGDFQLINSGQFLKQSCATRESLEYNKQIIHTTFMVFCGLFGAQKPLSLCVKEQQEHSAKHLLLVPLKNKSYRFGFSKCRPLLESG